MLQLRGLVLFHDEAHRETTVFIREHFKTFVIFVPYIPTPGQIVVFETASLPETEFVEWLDTQFVRIEDSVREEKVFFDEHQQTLFMGAWLCFSADETHLSFDRKIGFSDWYGFVDTSEFNLRRKDYPALRFVIVPHLLNDPLRRFKAIKIRGRVQGFENGSELMEKMLQVEEATRRRRMPRALILHVEPTTNVISCYIKDNFEFLRVKVDILSGEPQVGKFLRFNERGVPNGDDVFQVAQGSVENAKTDDYFDWDENGELLISSWIGFSADPTHKTFDKTVAFADWYGLMDSSNVTSSLNDGHLAYSSWIQIKDDIGSNVDSWRQPFRIRSIKRPISDRGRKGKERQDFLDRLQHYEEGLRQSSQPPSALSPPNGSATTVIEKSPVTISADPNNERAAEFPRNSPLETAHGGASGVGGSRTRTPISEVNSVQSEWGTYRQPTPQHSQPAPSPPPAVDHRGDDVPSIRNVENWINSMNLAPSRSSGSLENDIRQSPSLPLQQHQIPLQQYQQPPQQYQRPAQQHQIPLQQQRPPQQYQQPLQQQRPLQQHQQPPQQYQQPLQQQRPLQQYQQLPQQHEQPSQQYQQPPQQQRPLQQHEQPPQQYQQPLQQHQLLPQQHQQPPQQQRPLQQQQHPPQQHQLPPQQHQLRRQYHSTNAVAVRQENGRMIVYLVDIKRSAAIWSANPISRQVRLGSSFECLYEPIREDEGIDLEVMRLLGFLETSRNEVRQVDETNFDIRAIVDFYSPNYKYGDWYQYNGAPIMNTFNGDQVILATMVKGGDGENRYCQDTVVEFGGNRQYQWLYSRCRLERQRVPRMMIDGRYEGVETLVRYVWKLVEIEGAYTVIKGREERQTQEDLGRHHESYAHEDDIARQKRMNREQEFRRQGPPPQ